MIEDPNLNEDVYNKLKECGLKIGLTGQICCGKQTFIKYFKQYDKIENFMGVDVFELHENSTEQILKKIIKWQKDQKLNLEQLSSKQWQNSLQFLDIQQLLNSDNDSSSEQEEDEQIQQCAKKYLETEIKSMLSESQYEQVQLEVQEQSKIQNPSKLDSSSTSKQLVNILSKQLQKINLSASTQQQSDRSQNGKQQGGSSHNYQEVEKYIKKIKKEFNQNSKLEDSLKSIFPTALIGPLMKLSELSLFKNKINFHLICIEAPIHKRWERFQIKYDYVIKELKMDFEKFAILDDFITFNTDLHNVMAKANFRICYSSFEKDFFQKIENDIDYIIRPYRPSWDEYFITMAYALKARSNCVREGVGSVLVKDKRIIGAGYNGTPSNSANCFDFGCNDCRQNPMGKPQLDKCICLHAEEASILEAGINMSEGCTLYTTQFPCIWCAKCIVQAKLKRVVYNNMLPGNEESMKILQKYVKIDQIDYVDRLYHAQ